MFEDEEKAHFEEYLSVYLSQNSQVTVCAFRRCQLPEIALIVAMCVNLLRNWFFQLFVHIHKYMFKCMQLLKQNHRTTNFQVFWGRTVKQSVKKVCNINVTHSVEKIRLLSLQTTEKLFIEMIPSRWFFDESESNHARRPDPISQQRLPFLFLHSLYCFAALLDSSSLMLVFFK